MKEEFYTRLLEVSSEYDSTLLYDGRVCFDINGMSFVIDFEKENLEEEAEVFALHEIENLPEKLCLKTPQSLFIYYGNWDALFDPEIHDPKALTATMYQLVKKIRELNPRIVVSFNSFMDFEGLIEGVSVYCDTKQPWLAFKIMLDTELGATVDMVNLISTFSKDLPKINIGYSFFSKKKTHEALRDDYSLKILQTNTKARRLGYFKLLSTLFDVGKQHPVNRFNKVVEEAAAAVECQLLKYKNSKGLIKKTKSGISAKPYVELALNLDLINFLRSSVVQGKMFKVYSELREIDLSNQNYFELSRLDKLFFLEQILRQDALYIFVTLESLFLQGELSLFALQPIFQDAILKKLKKFEEFVKDKGEERKAKDVQSIRHRIENWEKPKKYLEHVLMPRLNWLFDLDLVSFSQKNTFSINEKGEKLLTHYWDWQDLYGEIVINPNGILDFAYITIFNDIYEGGIGNQQDEEAIKKRVNAVISDSFEHFRTIAPNRVTASQAIAFTQYLLFLKESIKTGKPFIRRLLSDEFTDKFIYKYQPQYKDGYIQIIKQS